MERITQFSPAWDRSDPDPKKNQGIHSVELRMVLKGELGAVQFLLYTGWYLKKNQEHLKKTLPDRLSDMYPLPADLGYHSPKPMYEGHEAMGSSSFDWDNKEEVGTPDNPLQLPLLKPTGTFTPCEYLDGKPCYYDGSGLNAERVYGVLLEKGSDGVWKELEEYYVSTFGELK